MVTRVDSPDHGFCIRWTPRTAAKGFAQLGVHIRPIQHDRGSRLTQFFTSACQSSPRPADYEPLDDEDVFCYLPCTSAVTKTDLGSTQKELFVPMTHPGQIQMETTARYSLDNDSKYRIRMLGVGVGGKLLESSLWSKELAVGGAVSFSEIPFLFLKLFAPAKHSSLRLFLAKHTVLRPPFCIPLESVSSVVAL
eukprot:GHVU01210835.1.p2 GENE.GHVU01210835.1~~GHVU01210835.1.p2  ORF type:complete len:194 (-),score=14.89 GHVU01210835.1:2358-2939(-)